MGSESLEYIHISNISSWLQIKFYNGLFLDNSADLYVDGKILTELVVPEGVTEIPNYAFYNYKKLKSVTISNSVTKIGTSAFAHCTSLKKVIISDSVTKIFSDAFYGCDINELYLGKGLTDIQRNAFNTNFNLKTVYYSGTKEEWENVFIDAEAFSTSYTVYFQKKQQK